MSDVKCARAMLQADGWTRVRFGEIAEIVMWQSPLI